MSRTVVKEIQGDYIFFKMMDTNKVLASLKGRIFHQGKEIIQIELSGDKKLFSEIGTAMYKHCKDKNVELFIPNIEKKKEVIELVYKSNFKIKHKKQLFFSNLKKLKTSNIQFDLKSFKNCQNDFVSEVLLNTAKGDPLELDKNYTKENILAEFFKNEDINYNFANIAFYENAPVGVLVAGLIPEGVPNEVEGTIFYFGILPNHRGKGLGLQLHRFGMNYLKEIGATLYYGSTSTENIGMQKIFIENDCEMVREQLFFKA